MGINLVALENGMSVLLVGFSVVFSFLVVLILCMLVMRKAVDIVNKLFPVAEPVPAGAMKAAKSPIDEDIAVAIAACLFKQK